MKRKIVFKAKGAKKDIIESNLLDSLLFGLGRTLQEVMDVKSGYSMLKSIGNNMIEHLQNDGVNIAIDNDPVKTIINLCEYYTQEGLVEKIEIEPSRDEVSLTIYNILGSRAFNEMCRIYGEKAHVRPSPLLALMLAALVKIGYEVDLRKLNYDSKKDIWYIEMKLKKIELRLLYEV